MKFVILLLVTLTVAAPAFGATFNRCSLAKKLLSLGVPKSELAIWTCMAKHESAFRTWVIGPKNSDGSKDYGIFQINNKYWCNDGIQPSSNGCNISCKDLLTEDIKNSVTCARLVKNKQGWKAWSVWKHCKGALPSIDPCFK